MIDLLAIPAGAILGRMAGGGLYAHRVPGWLPEALIASGVAAALWPAWKLCALLGGVWAYVWIQTGHGTAYAMGRIPRIALSGRKQTLSYVIDPLCRWLEKPLGGKFYCWAFMGLKGLGIGLPLAPYGLALAVLWPLSYEISWRLKRWTGSGTIAGEYFSGACLGAVIAVTL